MPNTVDGGRFRLIYKSKKHHYLWREAKSNALVISDHSADDCFGDPTSVVNTDDGVLYIDVGRIKDAGGLMVYRYSMEGNMEFWVPLIKHDGCCSCITGLPTACNLLNQPEFEGHLKGEGYIMNLGGDYRCALTTTSLEA
jgi:hypothetical protein